MQIPKYDCKHVIGKNNVLPERFQISENTYDLGIGHDVLLVGVVADSLYHSMSVNALNMYWYSVGNFDGWKLLSTCENQPVNNRKTNRLRFSRYRV